MAHGGWTDGAIIDFASDGFRFASLENERSLFRRTDTDNANVQRSMVGRSTTKAQAQATALKLAK